MHGIQFVNIQYSALDKAALKSFLSGLPVTQTYYYSISEVSTIIQQSKTASDLSRCHSKQLTKPLKWWLKKKICTISNQYLSWDFFHQLSRHAEGRLAQSSQQPGSPWAELSQPHHFLCPAPAWPSPAWLHPAADISHCHTFLLSRDILFKWQHLERMSGARVEP